MKKSYVVIVLLAILFLSMSAMSSSVKAATNTAMLYGHLAPNYDNNEKNLETSVCNQISWYFSNDYWQSCTPTNDYWTNTNNGVDNNILSQTQNGDYVTNWWVGDYAPLDAGSGPSPSPAPFGHFGFYGQGTDLEDKYIYGNATIGDSTSSVQYFDFIWTCANGGIYSDQQQRRL